ncbi:hypothetical protein Tco_0025055 [Tanacetum coccineum]
MLLGKTPIVVVHLWPALPNIIFIYYTETWQKKHQQLLTEFFWFVDKSLTQCRQSNLNKVQLDTPYCIEFQSQVTDLIRYAIKWNVQDINLQLHSITEEKFELNQAKLNDDSIRNIITGRPLLETFHLQYYCYGFRRIDIASKSVKNLVLGGHCDSQHDIIEINAPYILSLTMEHGLYLSKLLLLNVSSLVLLEAWQLWDKTT